MAFWDRLFTIFGKSEGAVASGAKAARAAEIAEAAKIAEAERGLAEGFAVKPAAVSTRTVAAESTGSFFAKTAKEIAGSPIVKTAAKAGAATVIIGGSAYVLGKTAGAGASAAGSGLSDVGYGVRSMLNTTTPTDVQRQQLENQSRENQILKDKVSALTDYSNFLKTQQISDSPSAREAFNTYVLPKDQGAAEDKSGGIGGMILPVAAVAGVGLLAFMALKKKKGGRKK